MPFITHNGKEYGLCLLDTNIISEISKNISGERQKFNKMLFKNSWIPCIASGSLFEIRRNPVVYNKFLDVFSVLPFFFLKPFIILFESERKMYDEVDTVSPIHFFISFENKDPNLRLRNFMKTIFLQESVIESENSRRIDEAKVIQNWNSSMDNFIQNSKVANAKDADRYVEEAAFQTILRIDVDLGSDFINKKLRNGEYIDETLFPSVVIMLYSKYYRYFDPGWKSAPQEVTDIEIISTVPYMDVVITENYQAEILRKIQNGGKFLDIKNIKVLTLRDIRKD